LNNVSSDDTIVRTLLRNPQEIQIRHKIYDFRKAFPRALSINWLNRQDRQFAIFLLTSWKHSGGSLK
jgi:hypothetical protein